MPVKRRSAKARHLDEFHVEQLLEGPDATLFAGAGYLHSLSVGSFSRASPEEQAVVLQEMREAWGRHGREMMGRWRAGAYADVARPSGLPWAAEAFGEPREPGEPHAP